MLGRDLVDALKPGGFELEGVGLGANSGLDIPYEALDLTRQPLVGKFWDKSKPDLVFHSAAFTNVDECEKDKAFVSRANTQAVEFVANASKKHNAPVVFFSTDFVFDGKDSREYFEEDKPNPLSYYGQTKADAEEILRESGSLFVVFRLCWLYGLRGHSFPRSILGIAAKQKELKVVGDHYGRPTYTRDVSKALAGLLKKEPGIFHRLSGQIFHLANEGITNWADFAEEILKDAGFQNHTVTRIKFEEWKGAAECAERPRHAVLSLQKAWQILGIQLRPWQEALKDFIGEYKKVLRERSLEE